MKYIFGSLLLSVLLVVGCTDPDLDPLQFDKLQNGAVLTLRGQAFENLFDRAFFGAVDSFSVTGNTAAETFEFQTDFLAEDPSTLARVITYARASENGPRVQVATTEASAFSVPSGGTYPRASISIPLSTILQALGAQASDFTPTMEMPIRYIYIENDIELSDGTTVPASAIVNGSLFESELFYPAQSIRYLATP